jgi:signal transduction histidine kinase
VAERPDSDGPEERGTLPFKRHLVAPGLILTLLELVGVAWPVYSLFQPELGGVDGLYRVVLPLLCAGQVLWWIGLGTWMTPIWKAAAIRRRGGRLAGDLAPASYRALWRLPFRALVLRTALWVAAAIALGVYLRLGHAWAGLHVLELVSITALHAFAISLIRSVWYLAILSRLRRRLFASVPIVQRFADGYGAALLQVSLVVEGATAAAIAAFAYYFLPITLDQYRQFQIVLPAALAIATVAMALASRGARGGVEAYLERNVRGTGAPDDSGGGSATGVYVAAQALPYRLAIAHVTVWAFAALVVAILARSRFRFEFDDAALMLGIILVIAIGASIYQVLWHRETMRPLLDHLTLRHRLPVRGIRTALSMRAKLLLSFGGMVFFAVGLSLFWGFIQYKNLVTDFTSKQADLGLAWLRSEVQGAVAARPEPPSPRLVREVLSHASARSPEASAVVYYLSNERDAEVLALGGGPMGAPTLPWYAAAQLMLSGGGGVSLESHSLYGRRGRLVVAWQQQDFDLGSLAVFYPSYRGRGTSMVRPLKELLVFFLILFTACGGIVVLTVAQFVKPIRRLEERADGMARGELTLPVSSGGEGDEVGRLTFALEEMRRALRDKLRSTEEVNLDLERAVQRRTADLAKKNRELAETLEKLTRAQDQLVRSEKMASIGQLVAGIAHEINNPVNAIVNTVGPLEQAMHEVRDGDGDARAEAVADVTDMLRVVQRGAQRTKAIVQALHNYSRTDDESLVDVDLNRSLEDSLELLRHVLKQNVRVERDYGEIGRVRGHAGQLNQVFMNLLTNAAQAVSGKDGATVWVATREGDDAVVIEVRDNGTGIPSEILPRIFDPFFTTKDVGEGSGLGLSIVHGIVERHGGAIEVDSTPGQGTTFRVTLPRDGLARGAPPRRHVQG